MIDSISNIATQQLLSGSQATPIKPRGIEFPGGAPDISKPKEVGGGFDNIVGKLVKEVDAKHKVAVAETNKMLLGETDNVHQSMIAMQEAGLAFNMMVEVRNKLVESYQQLMRMPV